MEKVSLIDGPAAPLLRANVDTDLIIRIERLTSTPRSELGPYAFEALRYRDDGSEEPSFVLNRPPFRGAPILLAGANFGCGSSREGAVSALWGMGIRCVIAESFGDIFRNNCFQNGLLPVRLPADAVRLLGDECSDGASMSIDLAQQIVRSPGGREFPFEIEALRRDALLRGLDEIAQTLLREPEIAAWQQRDRLQRPWLWNVSASAARPTATSESV
ncbi:3-isopropylmalate dehydratase small subunit [Paraburkholderia sp. BCC1886]|uniref:3-isopropylmalate dehydratase small subunit n=1 Tax=Paraburkholderia sp. BCC1886 TaxID=2562670 RepID=UPI001182FC91|nr:3-isopropylmalate dehydratase small subunit [Paraburkholderia sp. BCC1886]